MSCKQCVKKEAEYGVQAVIFTATGFSIVVGLIGMIAVWVNSWDDYTHMDDQINSMNWLMFGIFGALLFAGISFVVYLNIPEDVESKECRVQDS
jgi:hypothetical protein